MNVGHLPEQAVNWKAYQSIERERGVHARKPVSTRKRDTSAGKCNVLSGILKIRVFLVAGQLGFR